MRLGRAAASGGPETPARTDVYDGDLRHDVAAAATARNCGEGPSRICGCSGTSASAARWVGDHHDGIDIAIAAINKCETCNRAGRQGAVRPIADAEKVSARCDCRCQSRIFINRRTTCRIEVVARWNTRGLGRKDSAEQQEKER